MLRKKNKSIIISYITYRRLIGVLGILLPFILLFGGCVFGGFPVRQSISSYYYTNMRDFFIGLLFAISMFLITYKGYEVIDNIITSLIGIAGLGIALFPSIDESNVIPFTGIFQLDPAVSYPVHVVCASLFFILLAVNSIFLFTLPWGQGAEKTKNKKIRDGFYIGCGVVILVSLVLIAVLYFLMGVDALRQSYLILLLESIMLVAFGISWLVKGETIFKDRA